jgi:hypothetical protein
MDVTATMYPYAASGNNLAGGIVPDWAEENGRLLDNLRDSTARRRMLAEMTGQVAAASSEATAGAASAECLTDPAAVMVLGFRDSSLVKYNGRRLDAIARDRRQGWAEAMLDLLLAERGALSKLTFGMSEENIALQLRRPWVVIGSDAGGQDPARARGLTHPRAYGTFARVLAKYVRADSVLALEDAVRRMTGATAQALGLRDRGLLREGMRADVVLFDPARVDDPATYERPHQLARGVSARVGQRRAGVARRAAHRRDARAGAAPAGAVACRGPAAMPRRVIAPMPARRRRAAAARRPAARPARRRARRPDRRGRGTGRADAARGGPPRQRKLTQRLAVRGVEHEEASLHARLHAPRLGHAMEVAQAHRPPGAPRRARRHSASATMRARSSRRKTSGASSATCSTARGARRGRHGSALGPAATSRGGRAPRAAAAAA